MKHLLCLLVFCTVSFEVYTQRVIMDDYANYIALINSGGLVIKNTSTDWVQILPGASNPVFINNKGIVFKVKDSVYYFDLRQHQNVIATDVASFKAVRDCEWVAYKVKGSEMNMVLKNVISGTERQFFNVIDYFFPESGRFLIVQRLSNGKNENEKTLELVRLSDLKMFKVWPVNAGDEQQMLNYTFDANTGSLALLVKRRIEVKYVNSLWYYKIGMERSVPLIDDNSQGIDSGLTIDENVPGFSRKGNRIYFYLKEKEAEKKKMGMPNVDIWSYRDARLQSNQLNDLGPRSYAAVVTIANRQIIRLENQNEFLMGTSPFSKMIGGEKTEDYTLICQWAGDIRSYSSNVVLYMMNEFNWNKATASVIYLVSNSDGRRIMLKEKGMTNAGAEPCYRFSPSGRYVVYYNEEEKNYFKYDIKTGERKNITKDVPVNWEIADSGVAFRIYHSPVGIVTWLEGDKAVLIRDHFADIWSIDVENKRNPVNVTAGFGRLKQLRFDLITADQKLSIKPEKVIMKALNGKNNMQGFYQIDVKGFEKPARLTEGEYKYGYIEKAKGKKVYLVNRESPNEPITTFYTNDFKTYKPIKGSEFSGYKGIPKQIVSWKSIDGVLLRGILYKPVNFDSGKKYPLIFYYYEGIPNHRFDYYSFDEWQVDASSSSEGTLPVNYCINNGYLVFIPDVKYTYGKPGESIANAIVAAANQLKKMPFVDSSKLGLNGHSFGGYETNYLITHTNLFAAACSASGVSDLISLFGVEEQDEQGYSQAAAIENGQLRLGATMWERPDLYINNSPIFYADKVTTPLLMMNNRKDYRYPFSQGVEFFKALRRLGKRVWMLQYAEAGHSTYGDDAKDFGIRMMQFFDHYLKGSPPPKWMTKGVPARMKGIVVGLELDNIIKTPEAGLLVDEITR